MYNIEELLKISESDIKSLNLPAEPQKLYAPIEYTLEAGGKRIRQLVTLLSCNLFSDDISAARSAAIAVEVFHNFTLLHDDIMDNAAVRRGRDSVHVKWNPNVAILSGDAMSIYAYKLLAEVPERYLKKVLDIFNEMAIGVCEGQQYDMDFEIRDDVKEAEYLNMIRLKTSVLIAGAIEIGAILGGAKDKDADIMYRFGEAVGMAFQLQDDVLDTYGQENVLGKAIGGDIEANKKTYLLINALNLAKEDSAKELKMFIAENSLSRQDKFDKVKALYDKLGVAEIAISKSDGYFDQAIDFLNKVEVAPERKKFMEEFVMNLKGRNK